jgi:serine/threonine-protein kinase
LVSPPDSALGQSFEGGVIYQRPGFDPVAVPKACVEFISRTLDVAYRLGFPVAEETSMGSGGDRIQLFENGNVTLLDGKREIWLRPQESGGSGNQWVVPGYTEERELGHGSTSRVVAAVHMASGDRVAIKYLAPRLFSDLEFLAAFRQEADLRRELRDVPQIVRLRDYREEDGHGAAMVMELVDGVSLHQMITRYGSTTPESALIVLRDSLLGLAAVHQRGMVHRDYKPENVLVDARGHSKLTDFGLAVVAGKNAPAAGTPLYMAPEVWTGHPASPASDVYAATAVFFECLTGRTPFSGQLSQLHQQHESAPVPMDGIDLHLRGLITRGMAKDPAQRPTNAMDFLAEVTATADANYQSGWASRVRQLSRRVASLRTPGQQGTTRIIRL